MHVIYTMRVGVIVKDIVDGAVGLRSDFWADEMGHSVAKGSPPLHCFFEAVLLRR